MAVETYQTNNRQDENRIFDWARELLDDGRQIRLAHEAQWWENLATYSGDMWVEFNVHDRKLQEKRVSDHKVRLSINMAQPMVRTEYAKLIKNRPIIDVLARSSDKSDMNAAEVGDKVLNNYVEKKFHMPRVRRLALNWVLICGLGGIFVDYDESLLGEIEVLVDPNGNPIFDPRIVSAIQKRYRNDETMGQPTTKKVRQGDLVFSALSPFQMVWDFSKIDLHDASWCIVSDVMDVDDVFRRWGVDVEGSDDVAPGVIEKRLLQKADLTAKLEIKNVTAQRLTEVHRLFIKPGHRYFPDGMEFVFTNDEEIARGPLRYQHGELPVSVMGHIPFPVSRYPLSVVQAIRQPILELSKTESQLLENRNLVSNPPFLEYTQNRLTDEISNRPGLRLKMDYMPGVPDPHFLEVPEMPVYVQNMIPILKEHILEIAGQGETSQGKVPAGARSGVAIAYLQEEDDTRLGPTVMEYEEMLERVAGQTLSLVAENYDAPRTIRIYKRHSEVEVFDFMGTMLAGVAGVEVQAGSALPRSKAAKQQFMFDLWDRQIEQDPRKIKDMLELAEGDPDEWEIDIEQAERENKKMQQGEQVEVEEWYNHTAHHYVHRRFMKSADFEDLAPEIQQIFKEHDAMHSREEMDQQRTQMEEQAMAGQAPQTTPQQQAPIRGGQVANGQNAPGPQPPFANPQDQPSLLDAQPQ